MKYLVNFIWQIMKYAIIFLWKASLAINLVIERSLKCLISFIIIIWSFKFDKKEHEFWSEYHFLLPLIFVGIKTKSLKNYIQCTNWEIYDLTSLG